MRKVIILFFTIICSSAIFAQDINNNLFKGIIGNAEYRIYIKMNFVDNNIMISGQEFFGELPGLLGDSIDYRVWIITSAEIHDKTATLSIINDYGSEDLTATLTYQGNNIYILKQVEGSDIKIARNRKWKKIPKELVFIRTKEL